MLVCACFGGIFLLNALQITYFVSIAGITLCMLSSFVLFEVYLIIYSLNLSIYAAVVRQRFSNGYLLIATSGGLNQQRTGVSSIMFSYI